MPIPSPFHERTSEACRSLLFKDWAGYYAVRSYDTYIEREYHAIRQSAGLIDVTPLYKYDVSGPDAAGFLSRVMVRNITRLKPGQVYYCCWCDGDGKVVDDGTVTHLDENYYRVTSAEPAFAWLSQFIGKSDVLVEDVSQRVGALSLQGPRSGEILADLLGDEIRELGYFWSTRGNVEGVDVVVTRTGYTGDRGYEIWVDAKNAVATWDRIMEAGTPHGILPAGLDAMDITRVEAGFVLNGIDYYSAIHCLIESRKSTPYELGMGWMVRLKRAPFNGQAALRKLKAAGPTRMLVGLELDWDEYERLFAKHGLPPEVAPGAWREPVPVYNDTGRQVGYANSGAWSPLLKKNLALATVQSPVAGVGSRLSFEVTVEYERKTIPATVVERPFYDPPQKKAVS